MRGQAALEFISTYGWAIMALLVAIGALSYFGVFDANNIIPDKCLFSTGIDCKDYQLSSGDNSVSLVLTNSLGYSITVIGNSLTFECDKCNNNIVTAQEGCPDYTIDGISKSYNENITLGQGKSLIIECESGVMSFNQGTDKAKVALSFQYVKAGGKFSHSIKGEIVSKIEKINSGSQELSGPPGSGDTQPPIGG